MKLKAVCAAVAAIVLRAVSLAAAEPPIVVPPLPAPGGPVVNVSTESQLRAAMSTIASNGTIVIAPGTYNLTAPLYFNGTFTNITLRGATNNRDDVVLAGRGMGDPAIPYGVWVGGAVQGVTIANLTIRDIFYSPVMLNAGTESPRLYNLRLVNAGQQFVKANPDGSGGGVDNGRVEYSVFEYSSTSKDYYTNAVDVHTGRDWIVRNNVFRNIRAPQGQLAGPAVLMWNGSTGSIIESNLFINCQREISLGLQLRSPNDHSGGTVRNNFIYRSTAISGDTAILIADSPNTIVVHNTIFLSGTYPSPIELRFADTANAVVMNNLLDGAVGRRDGATGSISSNLTTASAALFVDPAAGDLHLKSTATAAIGGAVATSHAPQDWDGQTRPMGTGPDYGADEYATAQSPAPAAPTNLRIIQ